MTHRWLRMWVVPCLLLSLPFDSPAQYPPVSFANQGFSMRLRYNSVGAFGHVACPPFNPANPGTAPADSIGWEYPAGSHVENLAAAGLWVGGLLDTSAAGTAPPVRLVSTSFEGWAGPYYEMYPGGAPADTIWRVPERSAPKPPGWDLYWGGDIPYRPFSDDNRYCRYTDTAVAVLWHTPLRVKVVHSSFAWRDPLADGIHLVEYRLFNTGLQAIDSVYLSVILEPGTPGGQFLLWRVIGYEPTEGIAYWQGVGGDSTVTPAGVAFVHLPEGQHELRRTFMYGPGPNAPPNDSRRYEMLSSGIIQPEGLVPANSTYLVVLSIGPFRMEPEGTGGGEPLRIAVAFLAAPDVGGLIIRAQRARELYLQGTGVAPPAGEVPSDVALMQNYPNPFNASTVISYSLPRPTQVKLAVFNALGQQVAVLVNGSEPAGARSIAWNSGGLPSGVYYYRLTAGEVVQSRRMVLLR